MSPPKPSPADLKVMMYMEPEKAIAYLERKGFHITWDWHETDAAASARAFTVAKATSLDILKDLRDGLKGRSLKQYQKELEPVLKAKGWWGKQEMLDANTGELTQVQLGSPRRLQTIYQTNMQSAYMAGRYVDAVEAADTHPYAMYIAIQDASTRPSHAALHGRVFRLDDPVWQHICPPNGYNCRCRFVTMSEAEVKRRGLVVENSSGKLGTVQVPTHRDSDTGEVEYRDVTTVRLSSRVGQNSSFRPDVGFDGGPMASHLMDDVLYRKARNALPEKQALEEIQKTLLAPARQKAWQSFVQRMSAPGALQSKQTFGIGVMGRKELAFAKSKGITPGSGVIYIEDRLIASPKAARHSGSGNALTGKEWALLPSRLAQPEKVLWDRNHNNFLYILPSDDGRATKLALRFNRLQQGGVKLDSAATVFKVAGNDIQAGIKGGQYEVVR